MRGQDTKNAEDGCQAKKRGFSSRTELGQKTHTSTHAQYRDAPRLLSLLPRQRPAENFAAYAIYPPSFYLCSLGINFTLSTTTTKRPQAASALQGYVTEHPKASLRAFSVSRIASACTRCWAFLDRRAFVNGGFEEGGDAQRFRQVRRNLALFSSDRRLIHRSWSMDSCYSFFLAKFVVLRPWREERTIIKLFMRNFNAISPHGRWMWTCSTVELCCEEVHVSGHSYSEAPAKKLPEFCTQIFHEKAYAGND